MKITLNATNIFDNAEICGIGQYVLNLPHIAQGIYRTKATKTVVMVHDLYLKHFPDTLSKRYLTYLERTYRQTLLKVDHIITPSQFVRQDILTHYPQIPEHKISAIPNPVIIRQEEVSEFPIDGPYILSVNAIRYHKNTMTLIKAFEQIHEKISHTLVLTGPMIKHETNIIQQYIEEKGIPKVVMTGYVTDSQRNALYHHASLFVSPSLHEGFGITPVEAALFDTPEDFGARLRSQQIKRYSRGLSTNLCSIFSGSTILGLFSEGSGKVVNHCEYLP